MTKYQLKALREDAGLSQTALSEALGVAQTSIGNYERGERVPDSEILEKYADYFGVSTDYLLGRTSVKKCDAGCPKSEHTMKRVHYSIGGEEIFTVTTEKKAKTQESNEKLRLLCAAMDVLKEDFEKLLKVERVLGVPEGLLIRAHARDKLLSVFDILYPESMNKDNPA